MPLGGFLAKNISLSSYSVIFFVLLKLCFYVWSFAPKLVGLVWGLLANGLAFCGLSFSSNVIGLLWAEL